MKKLLEKMPSGMLQTFKALKDRIRNGTGTPTDILNALTGYDVCERLRKEVIDSDKSLEELRGRLRESRRAYFRAIADRAACQKEINGLLQRKSSWADSDVTRFTDLYRGELRLEQVEAESRAENDQLERAVDDAHQRLIGSMRERYQEEQTWSDKVRRVSTYGTVALMILNLVLFLFLQLVIEPVKRRRFVKSFESVLDQKLATFAQANSTGSPSSPGSR